MASVVEICNSALTQIGASTITSLTDGSKNADVCNTRFTSVKESVLRSHPWNCAVTRVALTKTSNTPAFGFSHEFALPRNCLRLLQLSKLDIEHRLEKDKILCDESDIEILYVADVNTESWDALLTSAVTAALAADICYALVGSTTLAEYFRGVYEDKLREARFVDATEGSIASLESDIFIQSRF